MEGQQVDVRPEDPFAGNQLIRDRWLSCKEDGVCVGPPVLVLADIDHLGDKRLLIFQTPLSFT